MTDVPLPDARTVAEVAMPDGRVLGYGTYGDPTGIPVLLFHGTPGSHVVGELLHDAAVAAEVRIIAPDRPGMGRSTPKPDRTLVGWADDVAALADDLELDRLRIIGYSGGGPYALACAARIPQRIAAVTVVSGSAPLDRPAIMKGSSLLDQLLVRLSMRSRRLTSATIAAMAKGARFDPAVAVRMGNPELTAVERVAMGPLLDRSPRKVMAGFTESTLQGARGAAIDYRVTSLAWGFVPDEIMIPVTFWHGEDDDVVPMHQVQGLVARIPNSRLITVSGASHLAIRVAAREILAELLSRTA